MPTQRGCDAYVGSPQPKRRRLRPDVPRHGPDPAGQDPALGVRLQRVGRASAARAGPQSVEHRPHGRRLVGRFRRPSSPPASYPIAHANDGGGSIRIPAAVNGLVGLKPTRDRLAQDKVMRDMPVRIISDGVLTRSVRDTAAFFREAEKVSATLQLPPIGDITRPGRKRLRVAVITAAARPRGQPRGPGADPEDRGPAREPRPPRRGDRRRPDCRLLSRRLPALLVDAGAVRGPHRPPSLRADLGPGRLDNLTLGLAGTAAATCPGSRWRPPGCAARGAVREASTRSTTSP